jgi:hypothetical protein
MLYKIWQHTTDDDDRGEPLRAGIRTETRCTQNIRSEQPRIPCLDLEGIPITPRLDLEKNQRQRHHRHPGEHAVRDVLIVRVVLQRGGEEFLNQKKKVSVSYGQSGRRNVFIGKYLQRNVHHHPPHHPEQRAVRLVRHAVPVKHQVPKHPADGLANSTHKAPPKPFPPASRRVVHRHRDAHAFGDVVHRDGHGERDAELRVRKKKVSLELAAFVTCMSEQGGRIRAEQCLDLGKPRPAVPSCPPARQRTSPDLRGSCAARWRPRS